MTDVAEQETDSQWCVLLPCSSSEYWALPLNTLAEIVTLHAVSEQPPEELQWRAKTVPVLDFGRDDGSQWRERLGGAGLVAVLLGLEGEGCDYWGVAVRGEGLAVKRVSPEDVADAPDAVAEYASAAFVLGGVTYQVPDLVALQRKIAASTAVA